MAKSPDAFRTISEVADWLGVQAHVLRFWESKFSQVKPIKRAGGRRYYRPTDMLLIGGIKKLLHDDGLTIKGVQKILREEGMSHVADMSQALDDTTLDQLDDMPADPPVAELPVAEPEEEKGVVLNFEARDQEEDSAPAEPQSAFLPEEVPAPAPEEPVAENLDAPEETPIAAEEPTAEEVDAPAAAEPVEAPPTEPEPIAPPAPVDAAAPAEPEYPPKPEPTAEAPAEHEPIAKAPAEPEPVAAAPEEPAADTPVVPSFMRRPAEPEPSPEPEAVEPEEPAATEEPSNALPAFLRRPLGEPAADPEPPAEPTATSVASDPEPVVEPEPAPAPSPKPRVVEIAPFTAEADFDAAPAELSAVYRTKRMGTDRARQITPLIDRLTTLRDNMNAQRRYASAPPS